MQRIPAKHRGMCPYWHRKRDDPLPPPRAIQRRLPQFWRCDDKPCADNHPDIPFQPWQGGRVAELPDSVRSCSWCGLQLLVADLHILGCGNHVLCLGCLNHAAREAIASSDANFYAIREHVDRMHEVMEYRIDIDDARAEMGKSTMTIGFEFERPAAWKWPKYRPEGETGSFFDGEEEERKWAFFETPVLVTGQPAVKSIEDEEEMYRQLQLQHQQQQQQQQLQQQQQQQQREPTNDLSAHGDDDSGNGPGSEWVIADSTGNNQRDFQPTRARQPVPDASRHQAVAPAPSPPKVPSPPKQPSSDSGYEADNDARRRPGTGTAGRASAAARKAPSSSPDQPSSVPPSPAAAAAAAAATSAGSPKQAQQSNNNDPFEKYRDFAVYAEEVNKLHVETCSLRNEAMSLSGMLCCGVDAFFPRVNETQNSRHLLYCLDRQVAEELWLRRQYLKERPEDRRYCGWADCRAFLPRNSCYYNTHRVQVAGPEVWYCVRCDGNSRLDDGPWGEMSRMMVECPGSVIRLAPGR